MKGTWVGVVGLAVVLIIVALDCGRNDAPTAPPTPASSSGGQLTANPSSVAVAVGATQTVIVSGGIPPYAIATAPSAIASAQLVNLDSVSAMLRVTGITIASAPTSVIVKDNTVSAPRMVTVPITVH